jgi:hypothetical protein
VDSPQLDVILLELPEDDLWDENIPLERGYKKAKLMRYNLDTLQNTYAVNEAKETYEEKITGRSNSLKLSKSDQPTGEAPIKIEYPMQQAFSEKLKLLKMKKSLPP